MALSETTLALAILDVLTSPSTSDSEFVRRIEQAKAWADAFDKYAASVTNVNLDPPAAPGNKLGFENALTFDSQLAATTAQQFGDAWAAYFTGMTFVPGAPGAINGSAECPSVGGTGLFGLIASSAVTAANSALLVTDLTNHFLTFSTESKVSAANEMAKILHAHTIAAGSVTVLTSGTDTTPPPTGPLPITNTCRVF